jgi:hypothetical protein
MIRLPCAVPADGPRSGEESCLCVVPSGAATNPDRGANSPGAYRGQEILEAELAALREFDEHFSHIVGEVVDGLLREGSLVARLLDPVRDGVLRGAREVAPLLEFVLICCSTDVYTSRSNARSALRPAHIGPEVPGVSA